MDSAVRRGYGRRCMRKTSSGAAVAVLLGLAAGAAGHPGSANSDDWSGARSAHPNIDFNARYRGEQVVLLRRFGFENLHCRASNSGGFIVPLRFSRSIAVRRHRFSHAETINIEKGLRIRAWGRFDAKWTRATGYIEIERGSGSCVAGSGRMRWTAKPLI